MNTPFMSKWNVCLVALAALAAGAALRDAAGAPLSFTIVRPPAPAPTSRANLTPPQPDISDQKLLPDGLFAACKEPERGYRCADYLAAAIALQTLPAELGEAQLRQWVLTDKTSLGLKSRVLCLLMFEAKPGEPFNPPWITPSFVQIVDGVPFTLKFGGLGGRAPGPPVTYFDYCYLHGQWTTRRYHPVTPEQMQAALTKFEAMLESEHDPAQVAQWPILKIDRQYYATEIETAPPAPTAQPMAAANPAPN